jgi:hypothetical protein
MWSGAVWMNAVYTQQYVGYYCTECGHFMNRYQEKSKTSLKRVLRLSCRYPLKKKIWRDKGKVRDLLSVI